jgi:hypothetical protein
MIFKTFYPYHYIVSWILLLALLTWSLGLPLWLKKAEAANLTFIKDTISDSDLGVKANHTIQFVLQQNITGSSTIVLDFPDAFQSTSTPAFSNADPLDYDIATSTDTIAVFAAGSCPSSGAAAVEITSISSANVFTFTHCNGTQPILAFATTTIKIGTHATIGGTGDSQLVNPNTAGSYRLTVEAPTGDTGATHIVILSDVKVTASVDTTFTFTVAGTATGTTAVNGEPGTTDVGTTATLIPWQTLSPGTPKRAAQTLTVATNARNGFAVTIFQDGNIVSSTGADIDIFRDGVDGAPQAWASPANILGNENTYGHQGITSEDSTLEAGDVFGTALYDAIGSTSTPLQVFWHNGPADGTTADIGTTRIGFKIEITSLQEAAADYRQNLTYIATPTF